MAQANVKGINVNGIKKMTDALTEYKNAIKKPYVGVNAETIAKHLKGSAASKSIVEYSKQLDAKVSDLVKTLNTLTTSLQQVEASYKKQDESAGSTLTGRANNIKS